MMKRYYHVGTCVMSAAAGKGIGRNAVGSALLILLLLAFFGVLLTACAGTVASSSAMARTAPTAEVSTPELSSATLTPTQQPTSTAAPAVIEPKSLIVIDAGHQAHANLELEPIGPGATTTKYKVAGGTSGVVTGTPEYERTLEIALLLEQDLLERGYDVKMVRTTSEVNISNSERAAVANEANADAFLRIHCNGSENSTANGAMTLCQSTNNPYNGNMYDKSALLANCVLDALVTSTGCHREYVWETDTMAGINWSKVPVTLIEVGYMTNPDEDTLLAKPEYQEKVASGIADGVDNYFNGIEEEKNE